MSKDDFETSETLLSPYIEIGRGIEPSPNHHAYVNVSTFRDCLGHLIPPFTDSGPTTLRRDLEEKTYCVYGVIGRIVASGGGRAYLNIAEPPVSRTLMGFLSEDILKQNLPKVYNTLHSD